MFFLAATLSVSVFLSHAIMIWCDNVSALAIASNPVLLTRKKKISKFDFHYFRECAIYKDLKVKFISSQYQIADVLTKGLPYKNKLIVTLVSICLRGYVSDSTLTKGNCHMIIVAISLDCCNLRKISSTCYKFITTILV